MENVRIFVLIGDLYLDYYDVLCVLIVFFELGEVLMLSWLKVVFKLVFVKFFKVVLDCLIVV